MNFVGASTAFLTAYLRWTVETFQPVSTCENRYFRKMIKEGGGPNAPNQNQKKAQRRNYYREDDTSVIRYAYAVILVAATAAKIATTPIWEYFSKFDVTADGQPNCKSLRACLICHAGAQFDPAINFVVDTLGKSSKSYDKMSQGHS